MNWVIVVLIWVIGAAICNGLLSEENDTDIGNGCICLVWPVAVPILIVYGVLWYLPSHATYSVKKAIQTRATNAPGAKGNLPLPHFVEGAD